MNDVELGRWVQRRRAQLGLAQGELSKRLQDAGLNWSQGTLSRVENGDRPIRALELQALARALDTNTFSILQADSPIDEVVDLFTRATMSAAEDLDVAREEVERAQDLLSRWELAEVIADAVRERDEAPLTDDALANVAPIVQTHQVVTLLRQAGATEDEIVQVVPEAFWNSPRARTAPLTAETMSGQVAPLLRNALCRNSSGDADG